MIVTVANRKGGVGKTTSAVFLAHALAEATGSPCTLIDADPQAAAAHWARQVAATGRVLSVPVLAQPTPRLAAMLPGAANIVIDTPPADLDVVSAAIDRADLVLVPTSASALDQWQVRVTVEAAARRGKAAAVLLTQTRRTRSVAAAEESLRAAGVRVLRTHIPLREALAMAFARPVRQLHGYDLVAAELLDALPADPYSVEAVRVRAGLARPEPRRPRPALPPITVPRPVVAFAEYFAEYPVPAAPPAAPAAAVGFGDDELVQRLKASMARLTLQK